MFSATPHAAFQTVPYSCRPYVLGGMLFSIHEVVNCYEGWTSVHFVTFLCKVVEANLQDVMMPPYFFEEWMIQLTIFWLELAMRLPLECVGNFSESGERLLRHIFNVTH
jgi:hypothetical protein